MKPVQDETVTVESRGSLDPIAMQQSQRGGVYTTWGGPSPKTLNAWLEPWQLSGQVMGLLFETLVEMHSVNDQPVGVLASAWQISPDGQSFTFTIHPKANWSDGQPVTAGDVQFFYDTIMNKDHLTTAWRVTIQRFERPEIIDAKTVRIRSREKNWKAFWDAGAFFALPKHIWEGQDFNKINKEFPVVSGPYELVSYKRNRFVMLRRRGNWWGRSLAYNQHKYNFDYLKFRLIEDRTVALEKFKKGEMDLYSIYTSSIWATKTKELPMVQKGWVVRQNVFTRNPLSFQGLALNMRREHLKDKRVREALAHLLNREQMNRELMYDEYLLLNSYFPFLYPDNTNPSVPVRKYDAEKAARLLDAAGWKVGPQGVRQKNGKDFVLHYITYASDNRHLKLYQEALKRAGIKLEIEIMTMAEVQKRAQEFNFDLYWINTGGSRLPDPEGRFHSKYKDEKGSQNLPGINDPAVDQILDQLNQESNLGRRKILLAQLDRLLYDMVPYLLLWQSDKSRLLYWNRFDTPESLLGKFGDESSAIAYWSYSKAKSAALDKAESSDQQLPPLPDVVRYVGP
ncbi:MAG: ABC transporter substrate-binding protein [Leptospiraceae bacterium]|nr:ABC transporter substrate-binding protein [Leptospiraceae bacterium]